MVSAFRDRGKRAASDNRFSQFIREWQSLNDLSGIPDHVIGVDMPQYRLSASRLSRRYRPISAIRTSANIYG